MTGPRGLRIGEDTPIDRSTRLAGFAGFAGFAGMVAAGWFVLAGAAFAAPGESAGVFLLLPTSARESALAETDVADARGAYALNGNPAAVARASCFQVGFSHIVWVADIDIISAAASGIEAGPGVIGVGVRRMGAGDLLERDVVGTATGRTLRPADLAVDGVYGWSPRSGVRVGAGVTFLYSRIKETATAITTSFGAEADMLRGNLTLAAALRNVGGSLKFIAESDPLPRMLAVGAAYRSNVGRLAVEVDFPRADDAHVGLGLEAPVIATEDVALWLRGGFSTLPSAEVDGPRGLRVGAGLGYRLVTMSYAWLPMGDLGDTHHITLEFRRPIASRSGPRATTAHP